MKKFRRAVLFLLSLMMIGRHPFYAAAETQQTTADTVSYCIDFSVLHAQEKDIPDTVYYRMCDEVLGNDEPEDDETTFLPIEQGDNSVKEAVRTSNNCFVISFLENELQSGKTLQIRWTSSSYLCAEDGDYINEYDNSVSYQDWISKKQAGTVASDGNTYDYVEKFYSKSVRTTVDKNGIASWETSWPYYKNWAVALVPEEDGDWENGMGTSRFQLVREEMENNLSQHSGSGYITLADGSHRPYYFERLDSDQGTYYNKDSNGQYFFDCHAAVNEMFGNQTKTYSVVVYSDSNTAAGLYHYRREDQLYARSAMLNGWFIQAYYLDLSEEAQNAEDVYLKLLIDDEIVYSQLSRTEGYLEEMDKWRFFFNIPMAKLNVPVHAYLCYNDKEVDMGEETAMSYIQSVIEKNEENGQYEDVMPVIRAMLNYAGYTQKYFGVNTDRPVNAGLYTDAEDPVKNISAAAIRDSIDAKIRGTYENEDMALAGVSLVCKTNTSVKLYFKPKNGLTAKQLYDKYKNYNVNTSGDMETGYTGSNLFYFKINDQSAYYLSCIEEHVELHSTDGHVIDMYYTPVLYIKAAMSAQDESLVELCKALYLFNRASVEYMTSKGYLNY